MKCEMCHKGEAKHPLYTDDKGSELYVCEECFNKAIDTAARACLEEVPEEDCFEGVDKIDTRGRDDIYAISTAAASLLVDLRNQLGKPARFTFDKNIDGTKVGANVKFDNIQKNITLHFSLSDLGNGRDNDAADSEWVFDLTDKKAIGMKAWCHFGNEKSMMETRLRFTEKNAPDRALASLVTILGGLAASRNELVGHNN